MADLSPAAKAILEAYDNSPWEYDTGDLTACAAVLRAVADQVVPEGWRLHQYVRHEILAIATELEALCHSH